MLVHLRVIEQRQVMQAADVHAVLGAEADHARAAAA
jgi:hypothetical protein